MNCPKISIVVPNLNQGPFIEKCFCSLLDQDYPNLEIIVMDGGSTDQSVDIIKKYEKHFAVWKSESDRGQAHAINKGFALATGEIINWLNADDRLTPKALAGVCKAVEAHPKAVAWAGCCEEIRPDGKVVGHITPHGLTREELADWWDRGFLSQPACFFRREAFEKAGPLDESLYCAFDQDLWLRLIANGSFQPVTEEVWAKAILHDKAKTQAFRGRMRAEKYLVQIHSGFDKTALKRMEKDLAIAERYYSMRVLLSNLPGTKILRALRVLAQGLMQAR